MFILCLYIFVLLDTSLHFNIFFNCFFLFISCHIRSIHTFAKLRMHRHFYLIFFCSLFHRFMLRTKHPVARAIYSLTDLLRNSFYMDNSWPYKAKYEQDYRSNRIHTSSSPWFFSLFHFFCFLCNALTLYIESKFPKIP